MQRSERLPEHPPAPCRRGRPGIGSCRHRWQPNSPLASEIPRGWGQSVSRCFSGQFPSPVPVPERGSLRAPPCGSLVESSTSRGKRPSRAEAFLPCHSKSVFQASHRGLVFHPRCRRSRRVDLRHQSVPGAKELRVTSSRRCVRFSSEKSRSVPPDHGLLLPQLRRSSWKTLHLSIPLRFLSSPRGSLRVDRR